MNEKRRRIAHRGLIALVVAIVMIAVVLGLLSVVPVSARTRPGVGVGRGRALAPDVPRGPTALTVIQPDPPGVITDTAPTTVTQPRRPRRVITDALRGPFFVGPASNGVTIEKLAETGSGISGVVYNGERITYTLIVVNQGITIPVTETIYVIDELPTDPWDQIQLDMVDCGDGCEKVFETREIPTPLGDVIQVTVTTEVNWTVRGLGQNETITRTFWGRVFGQADGSLLQNVAFVDYAGGFDTSDVVQTTVRVRVAADGQVSLSDAATWVSSDVGGTLSLDWGDFDRDGALDLAIGSTVGTAVYRNENGRLVLFWEEPNSRYTLGLRWADVNNDDLLELISVGESISNSAVLTGTNYVYNLNSTRTGFEELSSFTFTSTYQLLRVEPADYDGDGDIDLVVSTNAIDTPCPVLYFSNTLSNITGVFTTTGLCISTEATANIAAGDADNDGDPDLVLGRFPNKTLLLFNNGVFTSTDVPSTQEITPSTTFLPYDFAWGDYDGDGYLDLAAAYPMDRRARIYHNVGGTGFELIEDELRTGQFYTPLALDWGDFNGDGLLDLAVADEPPRIYLNTGTPGAYFDSAQVITMSAEAVGGQIWSLAAADQEDDGDVDLAFGNRDGASLIFTNFAPLLKTTLSGDTTAPASSVAWGDVDADGDLDLLLGAGSNSQATNAGYAKVYRNDQSVFTYWDRLSGIGGRFGPHGLAFGDLDGYGRQDVVLGTRAQNLAYLNLTAGNPPVLDMDLASWSPSLSLESPSVAWADSDLDRDLDLLVGNDGVNALYANQGSSLADSPVWTSNESDDTRSVAWGDYDGDGYLDFAAGNYGGRNRIYHNNGNNDFTLAWSSSALSTTASVAWADYDSDGDLDLAVGNYGQANVIYENAGGSFGSTPVWTSPEVRWTRSVAWGDWDNDGDLDLAVGNDGQPDQVYGNQSSRPGSPQMVWLWTSAQSHRTSGVAWGDADGDGDLDLAISQDSQPSDSTPAGFYHENTYVVPSHLDAVFNTTMPLPNNPSYLVVARPGTSEAAYFYSSPEVLSAQQVTVTFKVYDPDGTRQGSGSDLDGDKILTATFEYSEDGGGTWKTATPYRILTPTVTYPLTPSRLGQDVTFVWNPVADAAISDNARFRVTVVHLNSVGPVQRASTRGVSPPFRVRGTKCVWPESPAIQFAPSHPDPGQTVIFGGTVSAGSGVLTYTWDFGDRSTADGQSVQHVYPGSGVYDIVLRVSSEPCPVAQTVTATHRITVGSGVPNIYMPIMFKDYDPSAPVTTTTAASSGGDGASSWIGIDPPLPGDPPPWERIGRDRWPTGERDADVPPVEKPSQEIASITVQSVDVPATYDPSVVITSCAEVSSCNVISVTNSGAGISVQPGIDATGERIAFWSTGDLAAEPIPYIPRTTPVLLVDDDDNYPNVRSYYESALLSLGIPYDVWDTGNRDHEPSAGQLASYAAVVWFTGNEYGGYAGPGPAGESALASFLNGGKCLFISSQDYHQDRGRTWFMRDYLGVDWVYDWAYITSVTGVGSIYGGFGSHGLSYPPPMWYGAADFVFPGFGGQIAFDGYSPLHGGWWPAAVTKDAGYKTTFWGFPFETLPSASARRSAMGRFLSWCGSRVVINEIDLGATAGDTPAVEIHNFGVSTVNMTNWKLTAPGGVPGVYTFSTFYLAAGAYVVLHEGFGTNTPTDLYMEQTTGWANGLNGSASLADAFSTPIDAVSWGGASPEPPSLLGSGYTLSRKPFGVDTNSGHDWCNRVATLGSENVEYCGPPGGGNPDHNIEVFMAEQLPSGTFTMTQVTNSSGSILAGFNLWPSFGGTMGTRVVLFSDRDLVAGGNRDENFEIFAYDRTGLTFQALQVTDSRACANLFPASSVDGERIVFASDCDLHNNPNMSRNNAHGNQEIFVAQVDASGNVTFTQVTETETEGVVNDQPAISGDGTRVALVYDVNGADDIYLYQVDSLTVTLVAAFTEGSNASPALNDDGTYMAFASDRTSGNNADGNQEIYLAVELVASSSYTFTQISSTTLGSTNEQPAISGDGYRVAYVSDASGAEGVWLYEHFERELIQLKNVGDSNSRPSISANGMYFAFSANNVVYRAEIPVVDLEVSKTSYPSNLVPGAPLTYTITITNLGPSDVGGVVVSDALPVEIENPVWQCTATPGSSCIPASTGDISDTVRLLDKGVLVYVVTGTVDSGVPDGATVVNTVTVTAPPTITEHILGNNVAADSKTAQPEANLSIVKTGDPTAAIAGEILTYTLAYANVEPSDAVFVVITDVLPGGVTYGGMIGSIAPFSGPTQNGQTLTWSATVLTTQITGTLVFTVQVGSGYTGTLVNVASIGGDVHDPNTGNNQDTLVTSVGTRADLEVQKSADPSPAEVGYILTYTVVYTNHGPSDSLNVSITDTLPVSVTWNGAASAPPALSGPTQVGRDLVWTTPTLKAGEWGAIVFTVTVTNTMTSPGEITNTVVITSDTPDPPGNNEHVLVTQAVLKTDLRVSKTGEPHPVVPGEAITYTIAITNEGIIDVYGAIVSDTIPGDVANAAWKCASTVGSFCPAADTGNISHTVDILAGGRLVYVVTGTVVPSAANTIVNAALVTVTTRYVDPEPGNNRATASNSTSPEANLEVAKSAPGATIAGTTLTYTLNYTNYGPSYARNVTVTDQLTTGVSYGGMVSGPSTPTQVGNVLTWLVSELALNASDTIVFTVTVNPSVLQGSAITNSVTITSSALDVDESDNDDATTTTVSAEADLQVLKSGDRATVNAGERLTYTLAYDNHGPSDAQNVVLTDTLPVSVTVVSATPGSTQVGQTLSWSLGALADGASNVITIVVDVDSAATVGLTNWVTIASSTTDPGPSANVDSESTTVNTEADLAITKADSPDPVVAGERLTYTLSYTNAGPSDAQNVVVTDTLPVSVTVVSATPGSTQVGQTLVWNLDTLTKDGSDEITVVVTVDNSVIVTLTNWVTIASSTTDPNTADNATFERTTIAAADLEVSKSADLATVNAGETLTYTIVYTNHGSSDAQNVTITDTLPVSVTWGGVVSESPSLGGPTPSGRDLVWTTSSLGMGGGSIVFTVTVDSTIVPPAEIVNDVVIVSEIYDPGPGANTDTVTTTVTVETDVRVGKSATPDPAVPGGTITYTVVITNEGAITVTNVTVSDTFPAATFQSVSWSCTASTDSLCGAASGAGTISEVLPRLAPGGTATYEVICTVVSSATGSIANAAEASVPAGYDDVDPGNDRAEVTTPLSAETDLEVNVSTSGPVIAGNVLTYTIAYTNAGPSYARNVTVTTKLPDGFTWGGVVSQSPVVFARTVISRLYWTEDGAANRIQRMDIDGSTPVPLVSVGDFVRGMALDVVGERMYWVRAGNVDNVEAANLDDLGVQNLVNNPVNPQGIALDLFAGKMYWSNDGNNDTVRRANLDGTTVQVVYNSATNRNAYDIALDLAAGKAYWSDLNDDLILRRNLDGTGTVDQVLTGLTRPTGIALDLSTGMMYWVDGSNNTGRIRRANLSGTGGVTDLVTGLDNPRGIVLDLTGGKMYWTERDAGQIGRANLGGTGVITDYITGLDTPYGIALESYATWTVSDLPPGTGTIVFTVTVEPWMPDGTITSTVAISSTTSELDASDNVYTTSTTISTEADLSIAKSGTPATIANGQTLTYTLSFANLGPSSAWDVYITDTIPLSVTWGGVVTASSVFSGPVNAGRVYTWTAPRLSVGDAGTIVFTVTASSVVSGLPITNTVVINSATYDPGIYPNYDDEITIVP